MLPCSAFIKGIPEKSRATIKGMDFLVSALTDQEKNLAVGKLAKIAAELECSVAQLSIAWTARNPRVSTVITGASSLAQLQHNMAAIEVLPKLTDGILVEIDAISKPLAD